MATKVNARALWGLALAAVFAASVSVAQTFQVVHSFVAGEGADPQAGIVQMENGDFVGTTVGGMGTLFKMDARGRLTTVYLFKGAEDGANPHAPLTLAPDGSMYGMTLAGLAGWGGIYKMDRAGELTVLKAFIPSNKGPEGEGAVPHAPLLLVRSSTGADGVFYGVTTRGGMDDVGTIFMMDAARTVRTVRHFSGWDGAFPFESLIEFDGRLYGTTTRGGATDNGTIFRMDIGGGNFTVLHNFMTPDGVRPESPLIAFNGYLYGTTSEGGRNGVGTVYRLELSGANFSVLHHFSGIDGANPHAALVKARDGYLYGTTSAGGSGNYYGNYGNIFKMSWTGGEFSIVHRFVLGDGASSQSRLIEASDGALYGTTSLGGPENRGVIFRVLFVPVRSISPTSGPAAGGTDVAISGSNFQPGAGLTFAGVEARNVLVAGDSSITAVTPALEAGTLNDVLVDNLDRTRGGILRGFFADFLDVPQGDVFHGYVETVFRNRITAGIGGGKYGRDLSTTRAQMAVFLLKAKHGPFFTPLPATGAVFYDVPADNPFAPWIEELYYEGIANGCGDNLYCPDKATTRGQMAMDLLKALFGPNFEPPACRGVFFDVPCEPLMEFAPWIEALFDLKITAGCNPNLYCPTRPATRGQMAVFLTRTFNLQ